MSVLADPDGSGSFRFGGGLGGRVGNRRGSGRFGGGVGRFAAAFGEELKKIKDHIEIFMLME